MRSVGKSIPVSTPESLVDGSFFRALDEWLCGCLMKAISQTIRAHGPITHAFVLSAAKRMVGPIRADVRQYIEAHVDGGVHRLLDERDKEIALLKEKVQKLVKTADHWRALAGKPCSESNL